MKVVVTGASGNVGTSLLRIAPDGWELVGVARHCPAAGVEPYSAASWIECDIGGEDAVGRLTEAFAGADAVVHLAWAVQPMHGDPDRRRTNLAGGANVLDAVAAAGVEHLVVVSSVAAYAPAPRWERVGEDWPCTGLPGSAYSAEKAQFERLLSDLPGGQRLAIVRPCAMLQGAMAGRVARWMLSPWLPRWVLGRWWLPVPMWRGLRMQVVHADDVAEAVRLILSAGAAGAFNLAAEPVLPARRLAALLGGFRLPVARPVLVALAWPTWRAGLQPMHPGWLRLADQAPLVDTTRARTTLGWSPRHAADDTIAEVIAAIRQGRGAASRPLLPETRTSRWALRLRLGRPSSQSQAAPDKQPDEQPDKRPDERPDEGPDGGRPDDRAGDRGR